MKPVSHRVARILRGGHGIGYCDSDPISHLSLLTDKTYVRCVVTLNGRYALYRILSRNTISMCMCMCVAIVRSKDGTQHGMANQIRQHSFSFTNLSSPLSRMARYIFLQLFPYAMYLYIHDSLGSYHLSL